MHTLSEVLDAEVLLDDFDEPEAKGFGDGAIVLDGVIEHDVRVGASCIVVVVI